jgi:peptidyl-prolyl cis-trans isomerase A (cyclophilin A)
LFHFTIPANYGALFSEVSTVTHLINISLFAILLFSPLSVLAQNPVASAAPSAPVTTSTTTAGAPPAVTDGKAPEVAPSAAAGGSNIQIVDEKKKKDTKKGYKYMYAVLETSLGSIKLKLFPERAPETVKNFVGLAEGTKEFKDPASNDRKKSHFYDGLTFHRVIPDFMIQGGDPVGNGTGGPGYQFKNEDWPNLTFDKPGMLAMANAGRNTNGSQFFITVLAKPHLNGGYTIFGEVEEGMDVVKKISLVPRDVTIDRPLKPVTIKKVTILRLNEELKPAGKH